MRKSVWKLSSLSLIVLILVAACGDLKDLKPASLYSVSGAVSGAVASGVTVTLVAGTTTTITTTDTNGNFSFPDVPNGTHTVTPTSLGSTFAPTSLAVTVNNGNATNINFVAAPVITPTYGISGVVTGTPNVTVTLTGPTNGSAVTDANGNYSFANLQNGGYTVTPTSLGNTFAPTSTAVTVSNANVANINFMATAITYGISGTVNGAVSSGVVITLGGPTVGSTTTDANGNYSFANLQNGTFTITPTASGYTFSPTSTAVTVSNANVANINFTATAVVVPTYSVSGTVTGAIGVTVTLTGTANASATTDANGNYSFSGLSNGGYTATPSISGYTFNPTSLAVTVSGGNVTSVNFVATAVVNPTYTISGTVTGAIGVTVTLTGTANASATSDANGNYSFSGLSNGGYTITPTAPGYTFSPTSTAVTVSNGNAANINFMATAILYNIAGTVSGAIPSGVVITLDGPSVGSMITDVNGDFSFTGFQNGTYTVVPSSIGLAFNPTSLVVNVNNGNVTGVNFTATAVTYSISGTITGTPNATVTLAGPTNGSATTDANGNFSFSGLQNGNYTVVPSSDAFTFAPTDSVVVLNSADVTSVNFAATAVVIPTYSISGTVTGASGITVTLTGTANASATTDANGNYSFSGLSNGGYTVTPSISGYTFNPISLAVTVSGGNVTSVNFVATAVVNPTYTISGTVTGAIGVTVTLTGTANASASIDANGNFSFAGLQNGTYTITPTGAGYAFSPVDAVATVSDADVININFVVPPLATGKLLYPCPMAICSQDLSTGAITVLWGQQYKYPETIVPAKGNDTIAFKGPNINYIESMSLTTLTPSHAVSVWAEGSFDITQNADVAAISQRFFPLGYPSQQNIILYKMDGSGSSFRVTDGPDVDTSPAIGSIGGANSVLTILFVRNGTEIREQIVDPANNGLVGVSTVFASDIVGGTARTRGEIRVISVNSAYDQAVFTKYIGGEPHIVVKPLEGGAEVDLGKGDNPYWSASGAILYSSNGGRWVVNPDGTGRKQVPVPSNLSSSIFGGGSDNIVLIP